MDARESARDEGNVVMSRQAKTEESAALADAQEQRYTLAELTSNLTACLFQCFLKTNCVRDDAAFHA